MTSHRYHPDTAAGDPIGALLYDRCARCEQIAEAPLVVAHPDLSGRLWQHMVDVEHGGRGSYMTTMEAAACRELYRLACGIERTHSGIDPWCWPWAAKMGRGNFVKLGP